MTLKKISRIKLPIFHQNHGAYGSYYAPGYLAVVDEGQTEAFSCRLGREKPSNQQPKTGRELVAAELISRARAAETSWAARQSGSFAPVCLTLYLNKQCNLRCLYCYAEPTPDPGPRLTLPAIRAAARLVARNCLDQARPSFTLVCHGGGEPSLDQAFLEEVLNEVETITNAHGLGLFRYLATNGVMPVAKARWLSERFDLIGLSCDGPAAIQDKQRPLWSGRGSAATVERTAQIIRAAGTPLHIRVTVTPATVTQLAGIADYLGREILPAEIHVEPVYSGGRSSMDNEADTAGNQKRAKTYVQHFLQAETVARRYGIRWLTSGTRLGQIHGPYCHLFREVLNLVPGNGKMPDDQDGATACFKMAEAAQARQEALHIGRLDPQTGRFELNQEHIGRLKQTLGQRPGQCHDCFNQYHCTYNCPNVCLRDQTNPAGSFRCLVGRRLTAIRLNELAAELWANRHEGATSAGIVINGSESGP